MRKILASIFLAAAAGSLQGQLDKPNIIFILADDLGYGDLSCFGQETLKTPNLDRMAAEGLKFTRHYSGSTVCAPSRCVLLTGLHTGHCSIRGNGPAQLPDNEVTVAKLLKEAGYVTACIGKWGIGNPPPLDDPQRMGFDNFYGYVNMYHAHNFYPEFLIRNGERVPLRNVTQAKWKQDKRRADGGPLEGVGVAEKKIDYAPDLIASEALQFIEQHRNRPFFLYFAMNVPHANNEGGKDGMEVPNFGEFAAREEWPNTEKGFASMIRNIDNDVGNVLDKLKELGIDNETLVIFSSDNGPHQEGGHKMEYFNSNGLFTGMKRDLTDGGIRVPTIAWWPGKIEGGRETAHISAFQDFLPTAVELAETSMPKRCDGISLVPTLFGEGEQTEHDFLYWEFLERGGKKAVLKGDWKLIKRDAQKNPDAAPFLFNLAADPAEEKNVANANPKVVQHLLELMESASTNNTRP
ncbi:MAG: arylsulfatase A-like enzyme [Verrucomicrobiales bacterium]|jgi:arylsulfatase A-like enzyme